MEKGDTSVSIMEMFNKTSTFYEGKNGYQKKTCDFRIFENDQLIASKEFDMSSQIKSYDDDDDKDVMIILNQN